MEDGPAPPTTTLRLLQTTDLHMQLLPFDYLADRDTQGRSLQGLVAPIRDARKDGLPTLLLDAGDFLEGSPLADALPEDPDQAHPMIAAFNRLDYDAIALGNHEFEYGLAFLTRTLSQAKAGIVAANLRTGPVDHYVDPWVILDRRVTFSDGQARTLRIGVMGFTPAQVTEWSAAQLKGNLTSEDALSAALTQLPRLRRAGANLVVALCHGGPAFQSTDPELENPAAALARLRGIDAVLMGHLHETFPGPAFRDVEGADVERATLHGTPAMMPGSHGECLGQMDLDLCVDPQGNWRVIDHRVTLIPASPAVSDGGKPLPAPSPPLAKAHARARAQLAIPVCDSPLRLTSYFAAIGHDPTADLLARTQCNAIRKALGGTAFEGLPVLSATAPFRAGGHAGPRNFIDIPAGPLRLRDCHALAPFDNPVSAVLRRGWQVRQWLERSAAYFAGVNPGTRDARLATGAMAPYQFDTIHGLTYTIDLTRPPSNDGAFDRSSRIRQVRLNGTPLEDDTPVVVAASSYRAHGGGGLVTAPPADIIHETQSGLRALLIEALSTGEVTPRAAPPVWQFARAAQTAVLFPSAPAAVDAMPPGVQHVAGPKGADDFALYRLDLVP
ncbi:hypothetical protein EU805_10045 [Salipiger sp. IMCC34102]|uniref:5'-nucleotidase C-terminal domain-containing protein n=1 Tax=Salipiger sp. IMCC34102 TaxID=2510647 RepID=UPI00101BF849|nr:5'-nucleotidase C-terminal domain-containing protein [Salipiger sp. IMCC34102]RYH02191.1 hypothetical protein EU805_10045 [Salipiger sp. IMCC34102]